MHSYHSSEEIKTIRYRHRRPQNGRKRYPDRCIIRHQI